MSNIFRVRWPSRIDSETVQDASIKLNLFVRVSDRANRA